jgi:uncharacterized protein (TIGR02147 family)
MIFEQRDYRELLRNELSERCRSNPRYSLRAFARDLDFSPSKLSEVLNGKQGLSRGSALKVSRALNFNTQERQAFCDLVESQDGRSQAAREAAKARLIEHEAEPEFKNITADAFQIVSDWYHSAIIQLLHLHHSKGNVDWIAKSLGITGLQAGLAVDRLKRLGFIGEKNGKLYPIEHYTFGPDGIPSEAIRKFHRQVLEKAAAAISTQSLDERDYSTLFFPVPLSKLPEAKKMIKRFRSRFAEQLSSNDSTDEIYSLGIQFFRLSQTKGIQK